MHVLTYSVTVGNTKCNMRCPYCVSHMTPGHDTIQALNPVNLIKGADLAIRGGATTLLLTGKGEPTLHPELVTEILSLIGAKFPIVELQTNGLELTPEFKPHLDHWRAKGLTTIAISCVHWRPEIAKMNGSFINDLAGTVRFLQGLGFTVRLSVVMVQGGVYNRETMLDFIQWSNADQLTFRPVTTFGDPRSKTSTWIRDHMVRAEAFDACYAELNQNGTPVMELPHGGVVFDYQGKNVCWTNCLTLDKTGREIRQLIYCLDGHIRYDWRYPGAILF